jgi:NifU-like protein involved in Fe-S cluster formation
MIVSVGVTGPGTLQITSNICPELVKGKELQDIENVPFVKDILTTKGANAIIRL